MASVSNGSGDGLSQVLKHYWIAAGVFMSGSFCGLSEMAAEQDAGHLHLLRRGRLQVRRADSSRIVIEGPTLLLFPRPELHRLHVERRDDAELVCATIHWGGGRRSPLAEGLPPMVQVELSSNPRLRDTVEWLFEESEGEAGGRQVLMDRLCELVVIQLLRSLSARSDLPPGLLAGLAHPRLSMALMALHREPERQWTLAALASKAAMSRSTFAHRFHAIVGDSAGNYLRRCRVATAQTWLLRGRTVAWTAEAVGFSGASSLNRAFGAVVGMGPRQWLQEQSRAPASLQVSARTLDQERDTSRELPRIGAA